MTDAIKAKIDKIVAGQELTVEVSDRLTAAIMGIMDVSQRSPAWDGRMCAALELIVEQVRKFDEIHHVIDAIQQMIDKDQL